jgi:hypothetical protein
MKKFSDSFLVINTLPIGKTLKMNWREGVTVIAVIADVPAKTHFDFLLSYRRLP